MIEVLRRRSELRCTILREPHAQLQNHQDAWAAEPGDRLDIRPLLAIEALERVANWPYSDQVEGDSGLVMGWGPLMHGDGGEDGSEGSLRVDAFVCQLMSVKFTNPTCRLT